MKVKRDAHWQERVEEQDTNLGSLGGTALGTGPSRASRGLGRRPGWAHRGRPAPPVAATATSAAPADHNLTLLPVFTLGEDVTDGLYTVCEQCNGEQNSHMYHSRFTKLYDIRNNTRLKSISAKPTAKPSVFLPCLYVNKTQTGIQYMLLWTRILPADTFHLTNDST